MIRDDIVTMSFFHSLKSSGSVKIKVTCREDQASILRPVVPVMQEGTHKVSAVRGRVADFTSLQDGELTLDSLRLFL